MPQLSQISEIYASQLFWLAIVFALIYFGIGRAMVPRIEATIDDRTARIQGDLGAAESARAAAAGASEAYAGKLAAAREAAARSLSEAKTAAAARTEAVISAGDATSAERLATETTRINGSRTAALAEIESATVEAVEAIVSKLSGANVGRAAIADAVRAELSHG